MTGVSWPPLLVLAMVLALVSEPGRGQDLDSLRAAAESGEAAALFALAEMREQGQNAEPDLSAAVDLYRLAAERGHPAAQYRLGLALASGLGVRDDRTESLVWLRLASTDEEVGPLAAALGDAVEAQLGAEATAEAEQRVAAFRPLVGPASLPAMAGDPGDPLARVLASLPDDHCGPIRHRRAPDGRQRIEAFVRDGATGDGSAVSIEGSPELSLVPLPEGLCTALRLIHDAGVIDPELTPTLRDQTRASKDVFVEGDFLVVEVPPRDRAGHVALDYVTHDGHVLHMLPEPGQTAVAAGETLRVGTPDRMPRFEVAPPFGEDLLFVWWSEEILPGGPRPQVEPLDDYLRALRASLAGGERPRAGFRIVRTAPG